MRRIKDAKKTNQLETISFGLRIITIQLFMNDSGGTKTTACKLLHISLKLVLDFVGLVVYAKVDDNTCYMLVDTLKLARRSFQIGELRTLVDGVEWLEVQKFDTCMGTRGITKGRDNGSINSILVLSVEGIGSKKHEVIGRRDHRCGW